MRVAIAQPGGHFKCRERPAMSEPVTYFWVALAAIIILVDLWAIVSVFRSDKTDSTKAIQASGCSQE